MKLALITSALLFACSGAMAAGQGSSHAKDPNSAPAHGSFVASSNASPTALVNANINSVLSPVPEADAVAMLAAGAAIVGAVALRRRNKK